MLIFILLNNKIPDSPHLHCFIYTASRRISIALLERHLQQTGNVYFFIIFIPRIVMPCFL